MDRVVERLLPRAVGLSRRERRVLVALFGALATTIAASSVSLLAPSRLSTSFVDNWSSIAVYGLVAAIVGVRALKTQTKRLAIALLAIALGLYGLGYVLWTLWVGRLQHPPIPSICDALWLSFYPLTLAGIILFARGGTHRSVRAAVDGLTVTCATVALGAQVVLTPVLAKANGDSLAFFTELAYPIGDVALVAVVIGILSLRGWRLDRMWSLLMGGFLLLAAADAAYAVQVSNGLIQPSELINLIYLIGAAMLALAVWQVQLDNSAPPRDPLEGAKTPTPFAALALGLLLFDHFHDLNGVAWVFAVTAVLAMITRRVLAFSDFRALAESRWQNELDSSTGLPNRRVFIQRLQMAISAASVRRHRLTLLVLDLNDFKQLNETLGHEAGDELLQMIGPRVQRVLRSGDVLARLGGDEFGLLLRESAGADAGERVARKLRWVLERPFIVSGLPLRVTASIGIASYPDDGHDGEDLLKHADVAMYQAKASHSGHAHYRADRDLHSRERLMIAHELTEALEHHELHVEFQAQADDSGVIHGAEALVRWTRRDGTRMPPDSFLPVAEQAGLSRDLTRLVLNVALDELAEWRQMQPELNVSVNATVADLLDEHFPDEVGDALSVRGLPAEALVLEITETSVLSDPVRIGAVLERLRDLGVCLSLDDFGTGFSSLEHLRFLPVSELKIDQSFVRRMLTDTTDAAIVQATALLAQRLGLKVVAEGVEDQETWSIVAGWGCDLIQGYVLSRPVLAADFVRLLRAAPSEHAPV
jgi:diguanylate cyclase (GGDEF)-like protein